MMVERRGGQTLSLDLQPADDAVILTPSDFDFTVPEGVEVQRVGDF